MREYDQLKELHHILAPFAQATDECQGEKIVTISFVVPSILALHRHLMESEKTATYLKSLITKLDAGLKTRFSGVFKNMELNTFEPANDLPFGDVMYLAGAVLDPTFGLAFIDHDVADLDNNSREDIKVRTKGWIMTFIKDIYPCIDDVDDVEPVVAEPTEQQAGSDHENVPDEDEPITKAPRLFSYRKSSDKAVEVEGAKQKHTNSITHTLSAEYSLYIEMESALGAIEFWKENKLRFPKLFKCAKYVLSVPASSSPVERVFSHGGIVMRPHRACLMADNVTKLVFCKCNRQM